MHGIAKATLGALALAQGALAFDNGAPHSRLPVLGWSSWVALGPGNEHPVFDYCDANSVMAAADAFMEVGLYDAGYRHLHLDDCWAATERNATGYAYPEIDHFPNGMKPVIDYVHSKGLAFGLYTCGGTKTCVGGRVGSENNWEKDAAVYAEWGVDWVKMDWCNSAPQDPRTTYPKMSKALNESGRHIHFNMCEWGKENPWEWGDSCAQSWRMAGDHTGTWSSTKQVIGETMNIPAKNTGKAYGWNDMDMLETGNGEQAAHANGREGNMNLDESITEFSMWAIAASPLVVTTPIMNCTAKEASAYYVAKQQTEVDTCGPTGERRSTVDPTPEQKLDGLAAADDCSIALTKQISNAKCEEGKSFGCSGSVANGTMWTEGCRGVFTCNGVTDVVCNDMGGGKHVCACKKGNVPAGPPPPGPPNPPKSCTGALNEVQRIVLLNKDVIAINQDVTPQGAPVVAGDSSVWARHLSDGSVAVALYNEGDEAKSIGASFASLSWGTSASKATVKDLWGNYSAAGTPIPATATGKIANVSVRAHSTVVLRITKA